MKAFAYFLFCSTLLATACRGSKPESNSAQVVTGNIPVAVPVRIVLPSGDTLQLPEQLPSPVAPAVAPEKENILARVFGRKAKQKNVGNITYNVSVVDKSKEKNRDEEKTKVIQKPKDKSTTKTKTRQEEETSNKATENAGLLASPSSQILIGIAGIVGVLLFLIYLGNKKK